MRPVQWEKVDTNILNLFYCISRIVLRNVCHRKLCTIKRDYIEEREKGTIKVKTVEDPFIGSRNTMK